MKHSRIFKTLFLGAGIFFGLLSHGGEVAIVVPEQKDPALKTASEELSGYLKKITGRNHPVIPEQKAEKNRMAIYLGDTAFAAAHGIKSGRFGEEEWLIKSTGKGLIIAGGAPRGTLCGVYHYLEDVLGVHWFTPEAEYVPKRAAIPLSGLDLHGEPRFRYRDIYYVPGPRAAANRFRARNRLNTDCPEFGGRLLFGGPVHCHTMYPVIGTPDELRSLYKSHPEYFPLIDGRRAFDSQRANAAAQTQFCLTNPELRKLWVEKLRAWIRKDRRRAAERKIGLPMFYAIDQNDAYDGFCNCPNCLAVVKKGGAKSALMLDFTNFVARELKDEAPGSIFLMMAVHSTETPPNGTVKVEQNVGIRLCDTTSDLLRPWTAEENAHQRINLEKWAKLTDRIAVWDYSIVYHSGLTTNYPMPTARTYAPDMRFLLKHKGLGFFIEHEAPVAADMRDMKFWIETKLLENPGLDYEKLLRVFCDGFYGPGAGPKVREYLTLLENAAERFPGAKVSWFPQLSAFHYITPETVAEGNRIFDEAERLAAGNPEWIERLEHARLPLDKIYLIRASAMQKMLKEQNSATRLPDYSSVLARYKRVWEREAKRIGMKDSDTTRMENYTKFLQILGKRKELPVPPQFRNVPENRLFLFSINMATTSINYLRLVKDPSSSAGEALHAAMKEITLTPHQAYREHRYTYPFYGYINPTMKGFVTARITGPERMPSGYHWYKMAEKVKLVQNSSMGVFVGFNLVLDGVVSDNSELGQEYDIWVSIRISGPDYFKSGKPFPENEFYIDQIAVIRTTPDK